LPERLGLERRAWLACGWDLALNTTVSRGVLYTTVGVVECGWWLDDSFDVLFKKNFVDFGGWGGG